MIRRIQVAWKDGGTSIARGIRRLQSRAKGLAELSLMDGREEGKAMLNPAGMAIDVRNGSVRRVAGGLIR